jgi:hypothetical protein
MSQRTQALFAIKPPARGDPIKEASGTRVLA